MPASIGLTHLKLRSTPRHNYEQRLAALTLADEAERRELSSMWRNSARPTSVRKADAVGSAPPAGENGNENARAVLPSAPDLIVAPQHLQHPQLQSHPDGTNDAAQPVSGGPGRFLSPPTVPIRGPNSYMEDPRRARLHRNPYMVYFQSPLHDADVARTLVQHTHSKHKSVSRDHKATRSGDSQSGSSPHQTDSGSISSGLGLPPYVLRSTPAAAIASRSPTYARSANDAVGVSASMLSIPSENVLYKMPQAATVSAPSMGGPPIIGMVPISAMASAMDDSWEDNDSDDMGFTPNNPATTTKQQRRSRRSNDQSVSMLSKLPTTAPPIGGLPSFGGSARNASPPQDRVQSVATSAHDESVLMRARTADNHKVDPQRLRQIKSRYGAPPIDVMSLKPKCAVLHVKLEKLSMRMKAEDDEFAAFRDSYLKKLGCR